jgi:hypothetical protein
MSQKNLLFKIASLIVFIFLVNFLAMKFHWYVSLWYFDMFMHFLGGFWLGLAFIWLLKPEFLNKATIFKVFLGVFFIGLAWEFFEIGVDEIFLKDNLNYLDIVSDMFFDLAGGFASILYLSFKNSFFKKNTV